MDDIFDTAPCGFIRFADDGTILLTNRTLHSLLGQPPGTLEGSRLDALLGSGGRVFFHTHLSPLLRLHGRLDEIYLELRTADGGGLPVLANAVRHMRGGALVNDCVLLPMQRRSEYEDQILRAKRAAESARRATEAAQAALEIKQRELLEANAQLSSLAATDALTGLMNRRAFLERTGAAIAAALRLETNLSLLLIDVDHFKRINDSLGHPCGDVVLQQVARILHRSARDGDTVARYGGEEFAVLLAGSDRIGSLAAAERLRGNVERGPWDDLGAAGSVTVSIGASTLGGSTLDSHYLIGCADQALYAAKERGRNRTVHACDVAVTGAPAKRPCGSRIQTLL